MSRTRTIQIIVTATLLALVGIACAIPAGYYRGKYLEEGVTAGGPQLLVIGWAAFIFEPAVGLAWIANPMLVASLVAFWRNRFASAARWAAVGTALSLIPLAVLCSGWNPAIRWSPDFALWDNEGYAWAELRPGYFLWVAAHALMFTAAFRCWWRNRGSPAAVVERVAQSPAGRSDLWPDEG